MTYDYIPPIKSSVQRDILIWLVEQRGITVKSLTAHTPSSDPRSVIRNLRNLGWNIEMNYINGRNRYDEPTRYGYYYLKPEWKVKAKKALFQSPEKRKD